MTREHLAKMIQCAPLLPAPGDVEVAALARALLVCMAERDEARSAIADLGQVLDLNAYLEGDDNDYDGDALRVRRAWQRVVATMRKEAVSNIEPCVVCLRPVSTEEDGSDGCELTGGGWVCSQDCWDIVAFICDYRAVVGSDRSPLRKGYDALPERLREVSSLTGLHALSERARWEAEHPGESATRYAVVGMRKLVGAPIRIPEDDEEVKP